MLVASSLEYICPHEPQKPAVFAATAIPPQIRQAIAKATKAKAGSNTSRASPVISAVMVRGVVPHARQSCAGGGRNRTLTQIFVGRCYSFLDYPDAIHARAVSDVRHGCQADGSSRWGGLPRGGSGAEKG
ncbi:Uncharacterised protein [Shigella sonnei]|nr:Uncharacterised protein [Shigella sonnei]